MLSLGTTPAVRYLEARLVDPGPDQKRGNRRTEGDCRTSSWRAGGKLRTHRGGRGEARRTVAPAGRQPACAARQGQMQKRICCNYQQHLLHAPYRRTAAPGTVFSSRLCPSKRVVVGVQKVCGRRDTSERSSSNRHTNRHKTCVLHGIPPSARVRPRPSWPSACARGRCVLTHVAPLLAAAQPSGSLDPRTLYTMREAVSLHMGQSGVQTGNACWELYVSALTRPTEHQRPADPGLSGDASCVGRARC